MSMHRLKTLSGRGNSIIVLIIPVVSVVVFIVVIASLLAQQLAVR